MNRNDREAGATIVFVAASLFLLIGVAALAVDLSGIRLDRAIDQRVADAAASAGAITVVQTGSGDAACVSALSYVVANASDIASIDLDCSSMPTTCDPLVGTSVVKPAGRYSVTVVYPVPDAHALMTSGTLGAPGQSVAAEDGEPCDRVGVQISSERDPTFSQVLGAPAGTTTVHAVAIADEGAGDAVPLNLLILDRTGCQTVRSSGQGGVIVGAIVDGSDVYPGHGAADSDGSECTGADGVFFKEGSDSIIRADGPTGCSNDNLLTPTIGEGCGILETLAPTTPNMCAPPGCQANGPPSVAPTPFPTTMSTRLTRAPIDHRYNCVGNYATEALAADLSWATDPLLAADGQDIAGCSSGDDHIYDLIRTVGSSGAPTGFSTWSDTYPCTVTNPIPPVAGDWWVDCTLFEVKDPVEFLGNVVFEVDVSVTSETGALTVNNDSDGDGYAFFRDGLLTKDGQADLAFLDTFVYFSNSSNITMLGGTGSLRWIAPTAGDFEDLALWSDSETANHLWAGQAVLDLEGIFFVPRATVEYAGQSSQIQVSAQFVSYRVWARGTGALVLQPEVGRAQPFTGNPASTLVR